MVEVVCVLGGCKNLVQIRYRPNTDRIMSRHSGVVYTVWGVLGWCMQCFRFSKTERNMFLMVQSHCDLCT